MTVAVHGIGRGVLSLVRDVLDLPVAVAVVVSARRARIVGVWISAVGGKDTVEVEHGDVRVGVVVRPILHQPEDGCPRVGGGPGVRVGGEIWQVGVSYDGKPQRRTFMEVFGGKLHHSPSQLTKAGRVFPEGHLVRLASRSPKQSRWRRSQTTPSMPWVRSSTTCCCTRPSLARKPSSSSPSPPRGACRQGIRRGEGDRDRSVRTRVARVGRVRTVPRWQVRGRRTERVGVDEVPRGGA